MAAMKAKAEKALEADELAKRNARTPETAVIQCLRRSSETKAAQAKVQAKLVELEEAAKKAA